MSGRPAYPERFKGLYTAYVEQPYMTEGRRLWQACYVCGRSVVFDRDGGKWLAIGGGLIRHKRCEPPPAKG